MPLAPGARLGPYEIVGPLGAGGMGDVYTARDTRLERTVAVKVAKEKFEERFRSEALATASLNHPHICTLFDVGPDYLVMEHVEGKTLHGPLPLAETLRLALQIADALEHAHRRGIVHRDLKPSNILVTKQGVKILDFGLAKRLPTALGGKDDLTLTAEGVILGTPAYMSPEQIEGKPADERSDIFSFGLVLYEMLTGKRAFDGTSAAKVAAAILEREPTPVSEHQPAVPAVVETVVRTCLAKDPGERWQSVREMKHALEWASRTDSGPAPGRRSWKGLAGGAVALLAVALGLAVALRSPKPSKPRPVQLEIALPEGSTPDPLRPVAVSPDGERIVLAMTLEGKSKQGLFVRALGSVALTPLPGTEDNGMGPFWSPDGKQIAFFVAPGVLKKLSIAGGPPELLCRAAGAQGATWGREDTIIFSSVGRLFRVPAAGGEAVAMGPLLEGETGRYWPSFLPDGRHYLYLSLHQRREDDGVYLGALDSDLRRRIVATSHNAAYSLGHLLFMKDDALLAQPFDLQRLQLSGQAFTVVTRVMRLSGNTTAGLAHFSASADGVLVWRTGGREPSQLTWFDRSGKKLATLGEPARQFAPALSPDEKSVAVCRADSAESTTESETSRDIWILDVQSGSSRRLTFDPHDECGPTWSPDGKRIAFFSDRRGVREIYQKRADGSGDDELMVPSRDFPLHIEDWSADGRFLVLNSPRPLSKLDLFLVPLEPPGERKLIPFLATAAMEHKGKISPNGRWIVYSLGGSQGPSQIYVRDLTPQGEPGPGVWQISNAGGWVTRWRRDGREILHAAPGTGAPLVSVAVGTDRPIFDPGPPTPIGVRVSVPWEAFDVTRDGQRILLPVRTKEPDPVRVLVNWLP